MDMTQVTQKTNMAAIQIIANASILIKLSLVSHGRQVESSFWVIFPFGLIVFKLNIAWIPIAWLEDSRANISY